MVVESLRHSRTRVILGLLANGRHQPTVRQQSRSRPELGFGQLVVREGKGDKDRRTMLPKAVREKLRKRLIGVREKHTKDIGDGFGSVYLPYAFDRKVPSAAKLWGWQYVYPSARMSIDPRGGAKQRGHWNEGAVNREFVAAARRA